VWRITTRDRIQSKQIEHLKRLESKLDALDAKFDVFTNSFINPSKNEQIDERERINERKQPEQPKKRLGRKPIVVSDEQRQVLLDNTLTVIEKANKLGVSTGWVSKRSRLLRSES